MRCSCIGTRTGPASYNLALCRLEPLGRVVGVHFFSPPYYGTKGWIGLVLDGKTDWTEATALIHRSYRLVASKKLAALVKE